MSRMQNPERDKMIHSAPEAKGDVATQKRADDSSPSSPRASIAPVPFTIRTVACQPCPVCGELQPVHLSDDGRWAVACVYCDRHVEPGDTGKN